jgi:hypothetical protein
VDGVAEGRKQNEGYDDEAKAGRPLGIAAA